MADVTYIPDQQNQMNSWLPWIIAGNNGGFGLGGLNSITDLFGLAIVAQMFGFGNNWNGLGGGNGMAGFISNQISNDSGRELLMNAITSQGEAGRAATQNLATMIGQDFNLVNGAIASIQGGISSLALQQAVSVPQLMNSILSGDQSILTKLGECCCENRLAICQQTYTLSDTMNKGILALDNKIDALESNRKDREITALTAKVAQLESQNFTTGVVGSAVAPINAALASLAKEVDDIKCKQPNTVSVPFPNLAAVNMTPYVSGGFYQGGFNGYYGGGVPGFGFNGISF